MPTDEEIDRAIFGYEGKPNGMNNAAIGRLRNLFQTDLDVPEDEIHVYYAGRKHIIKLTPGPRDLGMRDAVRDARVFLIEEAFRTDKMPTGQVMVPTRLLATLIEGAEKGLNRD